MLRLITKLLPRRKTLSILLILLTVSLLQHTFTPAPLLQNSKTAQNRTLLLAQLPAQASNVFYKHSDKVPTEKSASGSGRKFEIAFTGYFITPVEHKLFDWHTLLYQGTLHSRDYA